MLAAFQKRNDALEAPKQHKIHFRKRVVEAYIEELKVLYKYFGIQWMKSEIKSVLIWENKVKSTISLFLYIAFVYIFEPWMISCLLLFVFLKNCYDNNPSHNHTSGHRNNHCASRNLHDQSSCNRHGSGELINESRYFAKVHYCTWIEFWIDWIGLK